MLTDYIRAAMRHATYELLPDDAGLYGEIPGLQGVYANVDTLEACREELQSVLEKWLMVRLHHHLPIPDIDGITLLVQDAA
jgi:predicted RNase H-like HicB family nuclease